jgi:hypothetical protein
MTTANSDHFETEDGAIMHYPVFTAESVGKVAHEKGWNGVEVAIMQQDKKDGPKRNLGTFRRNYPTNFDNFAFVEKFGRYFALYSPDYTVTRVMEIFPGLGWKDIGGEEMNSNGFCPTGFYVPQITDMVFENDAHPSEEELKDWNDKLAHYPPGTRYIPLGTDNKAEKIRYEDGAYVRAYTRDDGRYEWVWGEKRDYEYGWIIYPPAFGFVSGCYWGDDSSWKIQYLDLSQIENGIIKREDRFGYIELPPNLTLKQAIQADESAIRPTGVGGRTVGVSIQLLFDLDTGNCYVEDPKLYKKIVDGFAHSDNFIEREWAPRWRKNDEELKRRWQERHAEFEKYLNNKPYA